MKLRNFMAFALVLAMSASTAAFAADYSSLDAKQTSARYFTINLPAML